MGRDERRCDPTADLPLKAEIARPPDSTMERQQKRFDEFGLEEIDDGIWSVYYGPVLLARFDEREMKFYG